MIPYFLIPIPGSPLSLGRICLVLLGGMEMKYWRVKSGRPQFFYVMFFLVLGTFLGTFFSENFGSDFITFLGFSLLLISAYSASNIFRFPEIRKLIDYFFFISFIYWTFYVLSFVFVGGRITQSYGELYRGNRLNDSTLVNYHAFGLFISCALLYLDQSYRWLEKFKPVGIGIILGGIGIIFVTESRANLLIVLSSLLFFYLANNRLKFQTTFTILIFTFSVLILVNYFIGVNDSLARRFDVNDTAYIEQTTKSRFDFIWLVFDELENKPFGGGVNNTRVIYQGAPFQPHNQYLTFILFAGIFGVVANLIWLWTLIHQWRSIMKRNIQYLKPFLGVIVVTMLTLLTNDISGAYFFFVFMFQAWLATEIKNSKYYTKNEISVSLPYSG